jgi:2'-5' RNA ligase
MGKLIRRQASLYLNGFPTIDLLRHQFNPDQARLIPSHVTLVREDEVEDWSEFSSRVHSVMPLELIIDFGAPIRKGNLVYIPAVGSTLPFDRLRKSLLESDSRGTKKPEPRQHDPHITLIHPRNGICSDHVFEQILQSVFPFSAVFREISLIEQIDGGPWNRFA